MFLQKYHLRGHARTKSCMCYYVSSNRCYTCVYTQATITYMSSLVLLSCVYAQVLRNFYVKLHVKAWNLKWSETFASARKILKISCKNTRVFDIDVWLGIVMHITNLYKKKERTIVWNYIKFACHSDKR